MPQQKRMLEPVVSYLWARPKNGLHHKSTKPTKERVLYKNGLSVCVGTLITRGGRQRTALTTVNGAKLLLCQF